MNAAAATLASTATSYLDKAMTAVKRLGLPSPEQVSAPAVAIASKLAVIDEARTIAVSRVLQQAPYFNELIRSNLESSSVSTRFEQIVTDFDSIRDDAKRLLIQAERGKITVSDRAQNLLMTWTRGSIPKRFKRIVATYAEVNSEAMETIGRANDILEAYKDYRLSVKQGEITAGEIMAAAQARLDQKTEALRAAQSAAASITDAMPVFERGQLELARDEALRCQQDADKVYQTAKSLAENLHVAYDTTDVVMARMAQTVGVREKVYEAAVNFMATNETTLTAITAAYVNQFSLHEETQTLEATRRGASEALETLAEIGGKTLQSGIKAAYGANYKVESVRKLIDSVVNFQLDSAKQIAEERRLTTQNAKEIRAAVEDGRRRIVELTTQAST